MAIEGEHKYIVRLHASPIELLQKYGGEQFDIAQVYLDSPMGWERRIRCQMDITPRMQTGPDGRQQLVYTYEAKFFYTEKRPVNKGVREESEYEISGEAYQCFSHEWDRRYEIINKRRTVILYAGRKLEIDQYHMGPKETILEIEVKNLKDKVSIPPEVEILQDVTGASSWWSNKEIARRLRAGYWGPNI